MKGPRFYNQSCSEFSEIIAALMLVHAELKKSREGKFTLSFPVAESNWNFR